MISGGRNSRGARASWERSRKEESHTTIFQWYLSGIPFNSFPNFSSYFSLFFLSHTNSWGNVCNTLQQRQAHSSRDLTRKISRSNKESCGFPRNCAGVRHCVILVDQRRVKTINSSIEVGTSEHRVLTVGLSECCASDESRRTQVTVLDRSRLGKRPT